jgi:hypothetical protein
MRDALAALEADEEMAYGNDRFNGGKPLGRGRFVGVIVSWVPDGARIWNPPGGYAQVMVSPDGRIAGAPYTEVPTGFMTDGTAISDDSPSMGRYKLDAVALADEYISPGLEADSHPITVDVQPFVSGYVLEYAWGAVVITPDLNPAESRHPQVAVVPEGGWRFFRPLSSEARYRLDSMTATEVAQAFWRAENDDEVLWLIAPEHRYDYLSAELPRERHPGARVMFDFEGGGTGAAHTKAFKADPPVFGPETDEWIFIGRKDADSPWRMVGLGA